MTSYEFFLTDSLEKVLPDFGLEILETHSADGWYAYLCR